MTKNLPVNVAIVGVGLVGEEVVRQLKSVDNLRSSFRLVSLHTSSRHLEVNEEQWSSNESASDLIKRLKTEQDSTSKIYTGGVEEVVNYISHVPNLPRPLIVLDCTSSQAFADAYPRILANHQTHLVTPNKKAFSGSEQLYTAIQESINKHGNFVLKEATVGAGLPIISTLRELILTGDKVNKIEGVFSGTMSYIFNNFSSPTFPSSIPFSQVVSTAKKNGYTEPNPADDLNGSDVARKLSILARLVPSSSSINLPNGFQSVLTRSLVPDPLIQVEDPHQFMSLLPQFDNDFDQLRKDAFAEGCVLRYVGIIDLTSSTGEPVIKACLEKYPFGHPFATMKGSDNIISFHTSRYSNSPLIVQGSGAGAEVTAMGVVGDMIKVAERLIGQNIA